MTRTGLLVVMLAACSKAEPPVIDKDPGVTPKSPEIKVELAGVTLGEDCDGRPTKPATPPPVQPAAADRPSASSEAAPKIAAGSGYQAPGASMPAPGACASGANCGGLPQPACDQTAMQLLVAVPAGAAATKLTIKTVELLDDTGAVVGTLTARAPTKWDGQGTYVAWNEAVETGSLAVSYKLSAPDWNKLTNGIWNAASKKFALRVTVTISDKDRTIEKQKIVPVTPEPPVAT